MANDHEIEVESVEKFRLLTPISEPDFVVLRIETQDGKTYNFGLDRASLTHVVRVWAFDLGVLEKAVDSGSPLPGKPFGDPDKATN